jgi:multidrug transporter EmrE-like cation transporter
MAWVVLIVAGLFEVAWASPLETVPYLSEWSGLKAGVI